MTGRLFTILLISVGVVVSFAGFPFIKEKENPNYVDRVGIIEATEVYLSTKISERIQSLPYNEGDRVAAGETIVQFEMEEMAAEAAQAEADVNRGDAEILTAKAILEKEKAVLAEALRNLNRITKLYNDSLISTAKRDKATTDHELALAQVNIANARLHTAEAEREQHQTHLKLFQVRLKEGEIHAPIAGLVTLKAYEVGEMVSPGTTIMTLIDPESIWARVDLEEGAVGKIRIGGRADLYLDSAQNDPFPGKITEIGTAGAFATQRDTTRGRQDIKTFRVKIGISSHEGFLKPGMTVRARIFFESLPLKKGP